jgi:hypothetical protein
MPSRTFPARTNKVDQVLRKLVVDDQLGGAVRVLEVSGTPGKRVERVIGAVTARERWLSP